MKTASRSRRRIGAALFTLVLAAAPTASAKMDVRDGTEAVRTVILELIAAAESERIDPRAREARVRAIYRTHFDHDSVAAAILGRALRQAESAERQRLAALLEDYIVKLLAVRLADFSHGEVLALLSEPDGDGVVVYSHVASAGRGKYLNLQWRLRIAGDGFKIRDVLVERVSLVLTQRRALDADAAAYGGGLAALFRALGERIARLDRST